MSNKFCNICGAEYSESEFTCPVCGAENEAQNGKAKKSEIGKFQQKADTPTRDEYETKYDEDIKNFKINEFTLEELGFDGNDISLYDLLDIKFNEDMSRDEIIYAIKDKIEECADHKELISVLSQYCSKDKGYKKFSSVDTAISIGSYVLVGIVLIITIFANGFVPNILSGDLELFSVESLSALLDSVLPASILLSALFSFVMHPMSIIDNIVVYRGVKKAGYTLDGTKKKYNRGGLKITVYKEKIDFFIIFRYDTVGKIAYIIRELIHPISIVFYFLLALSGFTMIILSGDPDSAIFIGSSITAMMLLGISFPLSIVLSLLKYICSKIYRFRVKSALKNMTAKSKK